jgi:hypothetical protein
MHSGSSKGDEHIRRSRVPAEKGLREIDGLERNLAEGVSVELERQVFDIMHSN